MNVNILRGFHKFIWGTKQEYIYLVKKYNKLFNKELIYNYREL